MAVLAVFVAAVSLLGHRAHTEELLLQTKATDQWAFFQAKNIRRHTYELFHDLVSISNPKNPVLAEQMRDRYRREIERYRGEQKEIEAAARSLEYETEVEKRKANRFDLGELFLEAALVMTSITLLTQRRVFWALGMIMGLVGVVTAVTGLWIH